MKNIRLLGGARHPKELMRVYSCWKGGEVGEITAQIKNRSAKQTLLGKLVKTFHVEEEKLDEEIYDTDGSNRAGML